MIVALGVVMLYNLIINIILTIRMLITAWRTYRERVKQRSRVRTMEKAIQ
jgi:hypothetical protein